jgi:predicted HicB family RNase H-like nuclease
MMNTMEIDGIKAVINFDPDLGMFRGEFLGLSGGADFYAPDVKGLKREGKISLRVFMQACEEDGVEPLRQYSGKFVARIPAELHALANDVAKANGISLNALVEQAIRHEVQG